MPLTPCPLLLAFANRQLWTILFFFWLVYPMLFLITVFFCSVLLFVGISLFHLSLAFAHSSIHHIHLCTMSILIFCCYYYCFYCARCHPLRFIVLLNSVFFISQILMKIPLSLSLSTFRTFLAMSSVIFYATVLSYDHKRYNSERERARESAIEIKRFVIHLSAIKHVMSSRGLTLWHLSHSLSLSLTSVRGTVNKTILNRCFTFVGCDLK